SPSYSDQKPPATKRTDYWRLPRLRRLLGRKGGGTGARASPWYGVVIIPRPWPMSAGHASPVDYRRADLWPKAFLSSLLFSQFLLLVLWPHRGPIMAARRLRRRRARGRAG